MIAMSRVRLIHWNANEAEERAAGLRAAGYDVTCEPVTAAALRELRENPPAASPKSQIELVGSSAQRCSTPQFAEDQA